MSVPTFFNYQNLKCILSKLLCIKHPNAWACHQITSEIGKFSHFAKTYLPDVSSNASPKSHITTFPVERGTWNYLNLCSLDTVTYIGLQNKLSLILFWVRAMFLHRYSKMKLELKLFSLKILNCPAARRFSVGSKIKATKLRSNDVTSI